MKLLKTLAMGAILASVAGHASAQTVYHVTGSTAFRTGTTAAIIDYLAGATATNYVKSTPVFAAFINPGSSAPNLLGASEQVFANGYVGTPGSTVYENPNYTGGNTTTPAPQATTVIETSWTGSAAGLVDITSQESFAQFLDPATATAVVSAVNANQLDTATDEFYSSSYQGTETFDGTGNSPTADSPTSSALTTTQQSIDLTLADTNAAAMQAELTQGTVTYTQIPNTSYATYSSLSSQYTSVVTAGNTGTTTTPTGSLTVPLAGSSGHVAVCPFQWVVGNMTSNGSTHTYGDGSTFTIPTDITSEAAQALITNGVITQGILTNDTGTATTNADASNKFYLVGRNEDSASRVTSFAESGYNVASGNPKQYSITSAAGIYLWGNGGSQTSFTALNTFSHGGVNYIIWNRAGHSGYTSGGNVGTALNVLNPGNLLVGGATTTVNSFVIGYVGLTDAANAIAGVDGTVTGVQAYPQPSTAIPNGGMTYNGVPFTEGYVQNGQYPLWSYEHAYKKAGTTAGGTALDAIADLIAAKDADVYYVYPSKVNTSTDVYTYAPAGNPSGTVTYGLNHAENSNGTYTHYTVTVTDTNTTTGVSTFNQPYLAVGLFDDTAMNVQRTDAGYGGLISIKSTASQ